MSKVQIPRPRNEWVKRLKLQDWIKKYPVEIENFSALIEAAKTTWAATAEPDKFNYTKLAIAMAELTKDCVTLDIWIEGLSPQPQIPTDDREWANACEAAAWVIIQAHEKQLEEVGQDG